MKKKMFETRISESVETRIDDTIKRLCDVVQKECDRVETEHDYYSGLAELTNSLAFLVYARRSQ